MPKFAVRYYKTENSIVRYEMTVEAEDENAARKKVESGFIGDCLSMLTDEEWNTEQSGKEFGDGSEFLHLADPEEPFAVCEVV